MGEVTDQVTTATIATTPKKHNSNHLRSISWLCSAIRDSQQPISPIGFLFLKLPPPPCAVLLVHTAVGSIIIDNQRERYQYCLGMLKCWRWRVFFPIGDFSFWESTGTFCLWHGPLQAFSPGRPRLRQCFGHYLNFKMGCSRSKTINTKTRQVSWLPRWCPLLSCVGCPKDSDLQARGQQIVATLTCC